MQMMHSAPDSSFIDTNCITQQAVGQLNKAGLPYTLSGFSVAVTALSVSFNVLSCCEGTNSVNKDLSCLNEK